MARMIFRSTLLAFFACIVICAGLNNSGQQVEGAEHPAALILYPDATAIKFDERGGADRLSYHVNSKYPATPVIELISNKLQEAGWKPLKYDVLNPHIPSSHVKGWQEFLQGTKEPTCIHQWLGDWKDPSGNIVRYGFRYKHPECSTLTLTDLEVNAWYTTAAVVRQTLQGVEKFKKEHHLK